MFSKITAVNKQLCFLHMGCSQGLYDTDPKYNAHALHLLLRASGFTQRGPFIFWHAVIWRHSLLEEVHSKGKYSALQTAHSNGST